MIGAEEEPEVDVRIQTVNRVFNATKRNERVEKYVDSVYCNTEQNRKIRKAFRNQLMEIIKEEDDAIKSALRILQNKPPIKKRIKRQYKPTPYVQFCREMKRKYPHEQLVGKMQQMWRDKRRGVNRISPQLEKGLERVVQFTDKGERERYIKEMEAMGFSVEVDSEEEIN